MDGNFFEEMALTICLFMKEFLNIFLALLKQPPPIQKVNLSLKDSGTFSKCPQIYIKLTGFENNDSGKLPFKYY